MLIAKKRIAMTFVSFGFLVAGTQAVAQFDSGSDGSDGDFNPAGVVEIDLSLAADGSWNSPGTGNGVYDPSLWAVVFKYGTINIQSSDVVTFKNHPSGAPVVWLAEGDVTIDGTVSVNGAEGHAVGAPLPRLSEPGPGGFEGGHCGFPGGSPLQSSGGLGLGGALLTTSVGGGGGYGSPGLDGQPGGPGGESYGSGFLSPLIGGSGGAPRIPGPYGGGGAGGGAILIASSGNIILNGSMTADGGKGGGIWGGGGSGGAIRLIANNISGLGILFARGGTGTSGGRGGVGRMRVEAFLNTLSTPGVPLWAESTPGPVFPPPTAPTLTVTSIDGIAANTDPEAGILTTELLIDSDAMVPVVIETTNIPVGLGTTVTVRVVPYRGMEVVASAPLLFGDCVKGGMVIIDVPNYPHGRSELQVKANWDPQDSCP